MKKRFYITTPIYYPSGKAHLGHVYCTTLCDILARYKRLKGFETFFLTGTDEHGQKIKKQAIKNKLPIEKYIDNNVLNFKKNWQIMQISNNDFIRTTDIKHIKTVQYFFSVMYKNKDIYLGKYKGWYCVECESFWSNAQVGEKHLCPDCNREVSQNVEESLFFKCSNYIDKLLKFYENNKKFCTPKNRLNEITNTFIKPGLQDLSVSRANNDWGIQVLEKNNHTIYVWLDALFNYISALNYFCSDSVDCLYKKFWQDPDTEIVHVIGADISRFHCIYWPMFLMSCGLRLPDRVFVHGLIKVNNEKMSKSKKNSIDPLPLIEHYGVDNIRYFLAREIVFGCDGEFIPKRFIMRINNDLSNQLGNLVHRTIVMIKKYCDGRIPKNSEKLTILDNEISSKILKTIKDYEDNFDDLKVTEAIVSTMNLVSDANKYIDKTQPWLLVKNNKSKELNNVMFYLANVIYVVAILLSPVLINKSSLILDQLGVPKRLRNFQFIKEIGVISNCIVDEKKILFPRFNVEEELNFLEKNII